MIPGLFWFGPLWGTIKDRSHARLLKHPLRARMQAEIERNPGILPQALAEVLECNRSTIRYHVAAMQAAGIIRVVSAKQRSQLFVTSMALKEQDALAVLQRGRTWDLARQVARNPGQPQRDLTNNLQMSRKILRKYVDRLLQVGLIEEIEDPPFLTYFPTESLHAMVTSWGPEKTPSEDARLEQQPQAPVVTQPAEKWP